MEQDRQVQEQQRVKINVPRVAIVGSGVGVGTSTFLLGLLFELKQRGLTVSAGSLSPSLIEPTHYRRITGHLSHTIDSWLLDSADRLSSFARLTTGTELVIVEGYRGLFDKRDVDAGGASDAEIIRSLKLPVVLVVDAEGMTESLAALVLGFFRYDQRIKVMGVIANRVKNKTQNLRIKNAVEALGGPRYLGGLPYKEPVIEAQGQFNPSLITRSRLIYYRDQVAANIDISGLIRIAKTAEELEAPVEVMRGEKATVRVGVADDAAFHMLVQDNLDLLRRAGAELKAFSPLADSSIPPKCKALYFPSGYISLYYRELAANQEMLQSVRNFAAAGGCIIAEGDAGAYFCREFSIIGQEPQKGANILPAVATAIDDMSDNERYRLCLLKSVEHNLLLPKNSMVRGIRDSRWAIRLEEQVKNCFFAYDHTDLTDGIPNEEALPLLAGMSPNPNILISIAQMHWGSNPEIPRRLIAALKGS